MPPPDREIVLQTIESFLSKRVFRGWRPEALHYDFLTGAYELLCTNGEITVSVRLLNEWFTTPIDIHQHRHVKRALKKALSIQDDDPDQ